MGENIKPIRPTGCSSSQDTEAIVEKSVKARHVASTNEFSQISSSNGTLEFCTENVEEEQQILEELSEEDVEEEQQILYNVAELTQEGQQILIARGGEGGLGNVSISKDSRKAMKKWASQHTTNLQDPDNVPSLSAGLPGFETVLILELKCIADVGFVGMPNAGKSTLLGAISRAKPAVGHYAFTTVCTWVNVRDSASVPNRASNKTGKYRISSSRIELIYQLCDQQLI